MTKIELAHANAIAHALHCEAELLVLGRASGRNRNHVYEIKHPIHLYAKLPRHGSDTCLREHAILELLNGRHMAPVVHFSSAAHSGPVCTRPIVGANLEAVLESGVQMPSELLLRDLAAILTAIRADRAIEHLLTKETTCWMGPYRPDFDPRECLVQLDPSWGVCLPPFSGNRQIVHGSFSPNNLIVTNAVDPSQHRRLAGTLDWEGCRLGTAAYDEATLLHELALVSLGWALAWLDVLPKSVTFLVDCSAQLAWIWTTRARRGDAACRACPAQDFRILLQRLLGQCGGRLPLWRQHRHKLAPSTVV